MKTVALVIVSAFLTLFGLSWCAFGVDTVTILPSTTPNVAHRLRWATNSGGAPIGSLLLPGTNLVTHMTNGPWGVLHYTAVAVSTNGIESNPSPEAVGTNRPGAPVQVWVTTP